MKTDKIGYLESQISTRLPSLPGLRCFDAAARLESFSRAADALHLTHGAVSRAVRALEEDFGVALFERRNRRVFLTEAGRKLAVAVRDGFGTIEAATRELRMSHQNAPLVVSCEPTLLMRWLIPRLPKFQKDHPDIPVHLVSGGGPILLGNGVDLAIRRDDFDRSPDTQAYPLFNERIGPVCRSDRSDDLFAPTGPDGLARLRETATILHSRTRPDAWKRWEALTDSPPHSGPAQAFDHFYLSIQAAVAGIGVAIGPWQLVRDDVADGILDAPCSFIEDGSAYHLLAPTTIATGSRHAKLLDWLRQIAR